jgi:hypothetical protein
MGKEIIHKDIKGVQICVGDIVASSEGGYTCPNSRLVYGKVVKITPKGIKIKQDSSKWTNQIYGPNQTTLILEGEFIPKTKCKCSQTT